MNVYYSTYKLRPLKKANRLSSLGVKDGVFLKIKMRWTDHFADYFPHQELGDLSVDEFLEKFKFQDQDYEKKIFHFLLDEEKLRSQTLRPFRNHDLWSGQVTISPVVKYKIHDEKDYSYLPLLDKGTIVRLDANGLFTSASLKHYFSQLPKKLLPKIDYLEDPMKSKDWEVPQVPYARDFIEGDPYDVLIHKPNSRFLVKSEKRTIFSSYLGSDLGQWHAYCELLVAGNLNEYHGIVTPGLHECQRQLFKGSYHDTFIPSNDVVTAIYQDLHQREWKLLCSI